MTTEASGARVVAGRFELGETAGAGGMATVYRAYDRVAQAIVAVKILHNRDEGGLARFTREAAVLEQLRHPAIVRCIVFGHTADREPYLAMEWLDGEDLAIRLARVGLSVVEAVSCASRVAAALGHAHALGLVHRDVKPSNIFLSDKRVDRRLSSTSASREPTSPTWS
jgi:serine/threonine protein kinase